MENNNNTNIDENLVGYGMGIVFSIMGILFYFIFDNWLFFIGLVLFFIGFIMLAVQLDEEKYTKFSLLVLGLGFLISSLFLVNVEFVLVKIIFILFVALAIMFFVISGIYTVRNSADNKSVSIIIFQIIDIGAVLVSIINLVQQILSWI
ncbi:hypothetical protein, partial [Staphylococcus pseudintermedius]